MFIQVMTLNWTFWVKVKVKKYFGLFLAPELKKTLIHVITLILTFGFKVKVACFLPSVGQESTLVLRCPQKPAPCLI